MFLFFFKLNTQLNYCMGEWEASVSMRRGCSSTDAWRGGVAAGLLHATIGKLMLGKNPGKVRAREQESEVDQDCSGFYSFVIVILFVLRVGWICDHC
ncbi:hypothetical protein KFK09_028407 [Dendrobium nobile]|uniref:Uncharacterized protein n=1 Tax=Dendrobium nobile TaxID=94219 RepID=A0A8T3A3F7_DENNO|nr:hypothetical protein KFK09_028407 [Dendrobium nobile]